MYRLNVEEFLKRAKDWNMVVGVVKYIVETYQDSSFNVGDEVVEYGGYRLRELDGFSITENELIEV